MINIKIIGFGEEMLKKALVKVFAALALTASLIISNEALPGGLISSHSSARSATKKVAVCTVDKLNVRTDAGTEFDKLMVDGVSVYLTKDQKADIISEKGEWYKIKFDFGGKSVSGYILAKYVTVSEEKVADTGKGKKNKKADDKGDTKTDTKTSRTVTKGYKIPATVKADSLRVRTDAGTSAAQLTVDGTGVSVKRDETVNITGIKNDEDGKRWYKINTAVNESAVKGYVSSEFIKLSVTKKKTVDAEISEKSVKITTKATPKGGVLKDSKGKEAVLKKGKSVKIFYEVTFDDIKYFKISFKIGKESLSGYVKAEEVNFVGKKVKVSDGKSDGKTDDTTGEGKKKPDTPVEKEKTEEEISAEDAAFTAQKAYITADNVEMYNEAASDADVLVENDTGIAYKLIKNQEVTARRRYTVDGEKWYLITYVTVDSTGKAMVGAGFIPGKYIKLEGPVAKTTGSLDMTKALNSEEFEAHLLTQGFPEDYKPYLRKLHEKHPYWYFEAKHLNIDWNAAVEAESKVGLNLIPSSKNIAWKSLEKGSYDFLTDSFIPYDGSTWVTASKRAISYYMDPRNFLNEDYIYQFELLSYKPEYQSEEGVNEVVAGSPMEGAVYLFFTDKGEKRTLSYAETFIMAGVYSGVSPYHLASRVKQEVSGGGFSESVSGTVTGFEGIYNFYNIGAKHSTKPGGAVLNGLNFAKKGGTDRPYNAEKTFNEYMKIPWNNRYKAIMGGAAYIGSDYISRGQNTVYLEKFNFTEKSTYSHQYMANVEGAKTEAKYMKKAYEKLTDFTIVFSVPVFLNMPVEISKMPEDEKNSNNLLASLNISVNSLTPSFSPENTGPYTVVTEKNTNEIEVTAEAASKRATVTGTGKAVLSTSGETFININVTAENGDVRTYVLLIAKES